VCLSVRQIPDISPTHQHRSGFELWTKEALHLDLPGAGHDGRANVAHRKLPGSIDRPYAMTPCVCSHTKGREYDRRDGYGLVQQRPGR
jgi:hypothetical protein